MSTAKALFNIVISTLNRCFAIFDFKNFFLGTHMRWSEYTRSHISTITDSIITHYTLLYLVHNGYVWVEITKGLCGLPQADILAYEQLVTHLVKHGYTPCSHTTGLWKHESRDVIFCLVVDDFGVHYVDEDDAKHLLNTLRELYEVATDWMGSLYLGFTLDWD
jgi:hypothetical protein